MDRDCILQEYHRKRLARLGIPASKSVLGIASLREVSVDVDSKMLRMVGDSAGHSTAEQVDSYLVPSELEIQQLYNFVRDSPYIAINSEYLARVGETTFKYDKMEDVVNAYAQRRLIMGGYKICLLGGAVRFSRLVSIVAALDLIDGERKSAEFLNDLANGFEGEMTFEYASDVLSRYGLEMALERSDVRIKATAISAGMIQTIIAHEIGHIVLGHVSQSIFSTVGNEISQNMEREADSFASSVISASPFGEYMFVGMLFWHYALMLMEKIAASGGVEEIDTHPGSRERYENLIRANQAKAAVFGLSV